MTDKAPPHDTDAESAVLGAMLMGHVDVALSLCPDDFYYPPHSRIFEVITELHNAGDAVDQVTVASKLPREERSLVLDLANSYLPTGLESHVEIVRGLSRRRATIQECRRIEALAYEDDAIPEAMQSFMRLQDTGTRDSVPISEIVDRRLASLTERRPYFTPPGGGPHIQAGDYIVLGGYEKQGKSALAQWWAFTWAQHMKVAFYSYEMSEEQIADRFISNLTGYDIESLDNGCSEFEVDIMRESLNELRKRRLTLKVAAGLSVSQLLASLRTFRASGGQVAVIDYIQIATEETKFGDTHDVSLLSRQLRRLALDTGLTIVALSQFKRPDGTRMGRLAYPKPSDLKQSGSLEQDATHVALMFRYPDIEDEDGRPCEEGREARDALREYGYIIEDYSHALVRVHWARVRQGKPRISMLDFDGSAMRFESIDRTLNGGPL